MAQSLSATSHSYTIMPMYRMDGFLIPPLLIVIQEAGGKFPQKGKFEVPKNIYNSNDFYQIRQITSLHWQIQHT